ncbi:MAG TPA: site-2 protease family protein [Verrucomicrobiae bacterium]|nr:site-2 protease family protein [Verrucomicrobiae bacterium]
MFFTIVVILITLFSFSYHEFGHAIAFRHCKVAVEEISLLGFKVKNLFLTLPIKWDLFPGTKWIITPLFLGAYVRPEEAWDKCTKKDALYIAGMGPLMSIQYGLFWLAVTQAILAIGDAQGELLTHLPHILLQAGIWLVVLWAIWRLRYLLCVYVLLPLGCAITFIVLAAIIKTGIEAVGVSDLVREVHATGGALVTEPLFEQVAEAIRQGATYAIAFGLINLLVISPLDGGHMLTQVLPQRALKTHMVIGLVLIVVLFALQIGRDAYNLFRTFF